MTRSTARTIFNYSVHSLDFVKVTENAALAASRWMGRGERDAADGAAVEKMRETLGEMEISGRIVIGEGERDEAPMLYIGEELGSGGEAVNIAVDPVEGTNLVANGLPNSIAVMAISERGGLLHAPDTYMKKLAVGPKAGPYVHIDAPVKDNLEAVANALEKPINDVCVVILDRAAACRLDSRSSRSRSADSPDFRRRRGRLHRDGHRYDRNTRRDGHRRGARGRAGRRRDQMFGRELHGQVGAAQPTGSGPGGRNGFRQPSPRFTDETWSRATT